MKVALQNVYYNGHTKQNSDIIQQNKFSQKVDVVEDKLQINKPDTKSISKFNNINTENVITNEERQFFVSLFPESKEQIERHVLFNRNGRSQNVNLNKGVFVDGKV